MVDLKPYETVILNPKTIILETKVPARKAYLDRYHLKKVTFDSEHSINLGDKIDVTFDLASNSYNTYYYCNYMYKEDSLRIRINEFEDTDSSIYILPLLGIKSQHLLLDKNFVNCYIKHYDLEYVPGEYAYLIYRYFPINYYASFIQIFQQQEGCIMHQKDKDQRFDLFVFKLKDYFIDDVNYILNGEFSKISDKAKKLILNFHNQTNSETPLYQILHKGHLRRNELESQLNIVLPEEIDYAEKPKLINETWKYSK